MRPKMADAAPRDGVEYSFHTWRMSYRKYRPRVAQIQEVIREFGVQAGICPLLEPGFFARRKHPQPWVGRDGQASSPACGSKLQQERRAGRRLTPAMGLRP